MTLTYKKRAAVVTGAGRGIGKAIAEALAREGVHVICVSKSASSCGAVADAINATGGSARAMAVDVSDGPAVLKACEEILAQTPVVDILVNNAGITRDGLSMRLKDEDWANVLDVNLTSSFRLCRAAVKSMMKRRTGRIINISSIVGVTGNAGQANYAAAKAGLIGLSKSLAQEVASRGITVNCIAPGFIASAMTDNLPESVKEKIIMSVPQGRIGTPEEIATGAVYLASPEASYITGQTLHINGGMLMS